MYSQFLDSHLLCRSAAALYTALFPKKKRIREKHEEEKSTTNIVI